MKLLIASSVCPAAIDELARSHDVVCAFNAPEEELKRKIVDCEALVFRSGVNISAAVMQQSNALKLLIRAGSGLDNLDTAYVERHAIELVRVPEPGARAVAELGFAMMLALARQVLVADRSLRQGQWLKSALTGYLLTGKTLGVYGAGSIGGLIGVMGAAWDMQVIGCVAEHTAERVDEMRRLGVTLTTGSEVLSRADFLTVTVPLNDSTRGLLGAAEIATMKPGSYLINLARGGVVDEAALFDALSAGHLAGAGLDVHEAEGEGRISPLAGLANVILTPHIGAMTVDSQKAIGRRIIEIVAERC